jgi:hypothetical protein
MWMEYKCALVYCGIRAKNNNYVFNSKEKKRRRKKKSKAKHSCA